MTRSRDTDALRARRYRAHKRGDHSLCSHPAPPGVDRPARDATSARDAMCDAPPGTRGEALWRDMKGDELAPAARVLLQEACRVADRLDKLDSLLAGDVDGWITVDVPETGPATLIIDKALSEARQQQLALKGLMAELRAIGATKGSDKSADDVPAAGGAGIADLVARIAARQATG